ncbi:MAG: ATP-binding cassette domain-containing protein [Thermoplasma acidophilum]|nr:ATP-binding cassette domain-containing protein [Thermoplasma acidophilum]
MENREILLEAEGLNFSYEDFSLKDISIAVEKGKVAGILGITGCGKTTLLKLLYNGLKNGDKRLIWKGGNYVDAIGRTRPNAVYVPQSAPDSLDPVYSITDQIRKVMDARNVDFDQDLLEKIMSEIGRSTEMLKRKPQALSQGERHIAVVIMALMIRPSLIMMDEPTTSMDAMETLELLDIIRKFAAQYGVSFIISGTSPEVITYASDFVYVMFCGTFVESSRTEDLTSNPLHPYTRMMMKMRPSIRTRDLVSYRFIYNCNYPGCPFLNYCEYARDQCRSRVSIRRYDNREVRCVLWQK